MNRYAQVERRALADLLSEVGPDAPTLCPGWSTRDLAAHIVVRERRPDAGAGIVVPPLHDHGERVRGRKAAGTGYAELVERVRHAPWWSPVSNRLIDETLNRVEFFVHHEDVRRARPGWQPRELPAEQQAALWRRVSAMARLGLRRFRAEVVFQAPGFGQTSVGTGGARVTVVGPPGELVLFLYGRQRVARVQVDGPPELVEKLRTARLGI